jgi:hypothetical protein
MNWDQILVFLVGLAAVAYLVYRWRAGQKGACGGCGSCGATKDTASAAPTPTVLVQLDVTPRSPDTLRRSGNRSPLQP